MAPVASQLPPNDVFSQMLGPVTTQNAPPVNVPPLEPLPSFSGRGAAPVIAVAATAVATPAELPGMLDLASSFAPPPESSAEEVQNRAPVLNLQREIQRAQIAPTASRSNSSLAISDETQASLLQDIDPEVIGGDHGGCRGYTIPYEFCQPDQRSPSHSRLDRAPRTT